MGGFLVLLIMLNQELAITETQRFLPRRPPGLGFHSWLTLTNHMYSPPHQQASEEHDNCSRLLVAGSTHSWTRHCIQDPSPAQEPSLGCVAGQSLEALGQSSPVFQAPPAGCIWRSGRHPWLGGPSADQPAPPPAPSATSVLSSLAHHPTRGRGNVHPTQHVFVYFLIVYLPVRM